MMKEDLDAMMVLLADVRDEVSEAAKAFQQAGTQETLLTRHLEDIAGLLQHNPATERNGRFAWKRTSGYYTQSHAENAFSRYKRTFGGRLWAKRDASQEREASLACTLLNRMRELGRPQSYPVK